MSCRIFNREFQHPSDGRYMIEPKGEHPNHGAGVIQVIDDEAIDAIVKQFNADADAGKLRHGHEMLIDHEHFSDQADKESRAYGWLQELQARADGIYGRIHWTTTGQAAVDGGDYRFFSTEYEPTSLQVLNDGKLKRVRPFKLDGLSLTNMHNNRGQKPITNRERGVTTSSLSSAQTAARRIGRLALEEMRTAGCSQATAYSRVLNRENKTLLTIGHPAPIRNRIEILNGLRNWAAQQLLSEADTSKLFSRSAALVVVQNRRPIMGKLANIDPRTPEGMEYFNDRLDKLEPVAFKIFKDGLEADEEDRNPSTFWAPITQLIEDTIAQSPGIDESDPKAVWEAIKQSDPVTFYQLVLKFEGDGPFRWDRSQQDRIQALTTKSRI